MTISILSTAQDGTDGTWLDQLGVTADWKHTVTFPGGDTSATWTFQADNTLMSPALLPGRRILAKSGSCLVWFGRLEEPVRGQPWQMSAVGRAALAKDRVITGTGETLNDVVDGAISNGLPWTRPASLTDPKASIPVLSTVDAALGQLVSETKWWTLDALGGVSTQIALPTTPALLTYVFDLPARTLDGYANVAVVQYQNPSGDPHVVTVLGSSAEIALRGRIEIPLDLTSQGPLGGTSPLALANAQAAGAAKLSDLQQRTWSAPFVTQQGSLYSITGAALDVATVRPGVLMRVIAFRPDDMGAETVDIPVGQVDYDDDSHSIQLTPLAAAKNDFAAVLARITQQTGSSDVAA